MLDDPVGSCSRKLYRHPPSDYVSEGHFLKMKEHLAVALGFWSRVTSEPGGFAKPRD
jgi:hypothetical protein